MNNSEAKPSQQRQQSNGPKPSGQVPMGIPSSGYQYINKQVNNVKLVNNNNLTLNVRNLNNKINSINIHNVSDDGSTQQMPPSGLKTQRYTRDSSLG